MNEIRLDGVTKTYQTGVHTRAVFHNLNLSIPLNRITVVVGRSGCGKSTLLRLLDGKERADRGTLTLPEGFRSTMLSPEPYLITWGTVLQNITLASGAGLTPEEREVRARELMKLVGLAESEELTPAQLSTGMKQRLALARALATRSQLLLMDEPFAALDFLTRAELQGELLRVQAELPRTIVFVTHQLEEAVRMADQAVVIHSDGSAAEFSAEEGCRIPDSPAAAQMKRRLMEECMK